MTRRGARAASRLDARMAAQRAVMDALDAAWHLPAGDDASGSRPRDLAVWPEPAPRPERPLAVEHGVRHGRHGADGGVPDGVLPDGVLPDGAAVPVPGEVGDGAAPLTRRERRLAERREAERRAEEASGYEGPERRVSERRRGERRASLRAERGSAAELEAAAELERLALAAAVTEPLDVPASEPPALEPARPEDEPAPVDAGFAMSSPEPALPDPGPVQHTPEPPAVDVPHPSELPTAVIDLPAPAVPAAVVLPSRRALREARPPGPAPDGAPPAPELPAAARVPAPRRPLVVPPVAFEPASMAYLPPPQHPVVAFLRRFDLLTVWLVVLVVGAGLVLSVGVIRAMSGPEPAPIVSDPVPTGPARTLLVGVGSPDGLLVGAVLAEDSGSPVSLLLPFDALVDDGTGPAPLSGTPAVTPSPTAGTTGTARPSTPSPSSRAVSPTGPPAAATVTAAASRLSTALGVRLDASWVLGPAGLAGLVDAAGGVRVDVDRSVTAQRLGLAPGPARLTGTQAVAYATTLAANEQAEARLSRFQQVLSALVLALPADRARLGAVVSGLSSQATGTAPDATVADLLAAVRTAAGGQPLPGTIVPLRFVTNDDGDLVGRALDTTAGRALVERLVPGAVSGPGEVAVRLVDGVGRPGLTDAALSRLRAAGLGARVTVAGTDAPTATATAATDVQRTVVDVAATGETASVLGARIATALGVPADAVRLGEPTGGADVRVVLGPDFAADVAANGV